MFKLVVVSILVAVAAAKPYFPHPTTLVTEKTIESHGHSIVHATSPVLAAVAPAFASDPTIVETAVPYTASAVVTGANTIESHGNSVIRASSPIVAAPAPLLYTSYAAPVSPFVAEKTITSYGHSIVHHGEPTIARTAYIAPTLAFF